MGRTPKGGFPLNPLVRLLAHAPPSRGRLEPKSVPELLNEVREGAADLHRATTRDTALVAIGLLTRSLADLAHQHDGAREVSISERVTMARLYLDDLSPEEFRHVVYMVAATRGIALNGAPLTVTARRGGANDA